MARPKKSKDVEWSCPQCGRTEVIPEWAAAAKKFCSRACFLASGGLQVSKRGPRYKACLVCGADFLVGGASNPKPSTKYCSPKCRERAPWRQPTPNSLTDVEAAWLAGLFDGEGSIIFAKNRPAKNVRITITNCCHFLVERVLEVTGTGSIIDMGNERRNPNHSPSWNWACYGENARILLRRMEPWLIAKREKVQHALE